ncbi:MAG: hypothetical protein KKE05_06325 [Nanoarchaeota archaeon]|nr:hypothetical protein [Nanoarchaeota archaeon]
MKLFLVTLRGMGVYTAGVSYKSSYVAAEGTDEAYKKVREYLDGKDYGFKPDRELDNVKLLADEYEFNNTGVRLFL